MPENRLAWLDNAKMVAMICVIAGHLGEMFGGWPLHIGGIIVAFNMPLFVLLSGHSALNGLLRLDGLKALVKYVEKLIWRIVIPAVTLSAIDQAYRGSLFARKLWIVFAFVTLCLWLFNKWSNKETRDTHLSAVCFAAKIVLVAFLLISSMWLNMYWFLSMLIKLQISVAIIAYLGNSKCQPHSLIVGIAVFLWIGSYFIFDSWTFEMSIYFAWGLVLKQFGVFERILQLKLWISLLMFIGGCALCRYFTIDYGFYTNSFQGLWGQDIAYIYPLRVIVAIMLSCAIIRLIYVLSHSYNWFSTMGCYTLSFYTIHVLLLDDFIKPHFYFSNPNSYMWICGIFAVVTFTALTYLIIRVCEKWAFTRALVLGK